MGLNGCCAVKPIIKHAHKQVLPAGMQRRSMPSEPFLSERVFTIHFEYEIVGAPLEPVLRSAGGLCQ